MLVSHPSMLHGNVPNGIVVVGIVKDFLNLCPLLHRSLQYSLFFMAPHTHALACSQGQEIFLLSILKRPLQLWWVEWTSTFFEEECMAGLCSIEHTNTLIRKHFQLVVGIEQENQALFRLK